MNSVEKMALWSTFNALLKAHGVGRLTQPGNQPPEDISDVRVWWQRYESELELEVAYAACQRDGRVWD